MPLKARCRLAAVALVVVAALGATNTVGFAGPVEDQRQRVQQITDELQALEEQANILAEDAAVAADEHEQLVDEAAEAEQAVVEQRSTVAELQSELGDVAVQAFMGAGSRGLGALFTDTTALNDDLIRQELSRAALDTGTSTSDDLERELNELSDHEAELDERRRAAADKLDEVETAQAATEARTAEYREARAAAEEELGNLIREEEERRARESYERLQQEAAQAAAEREADQQRAVQAQQQTASAQPAVAVGTGGGGGRAANPATPTPAAPAPQAPTPATPTSPAPAQPAPAQPAPSRPIPAASSRAGTAVNAAMSQLGVPWQFAKAEPGVAFDCSGLTSWAWGTVGVYLPHQSRQQYATLPKVEAAAAQPGDLLFFYSPISHVGMYIGNGQMVHSPNAGSVVNVRSVDWSRVVGVARPG